MSEIVMSVRDLTKTYQVGDIEVRALRGASLDVRKGEFVAVTGPSATPLTSATPLPSTSTAGPLQRPPHATPV